MRILALFLFLLFPPAAHACSIFPTAEFCPLTSYLETRAGVNHAVVHLIGEEILYDQRPDGSFYAPIFRVRILKSLKGHFSAGEVLHLWTGDNWDCNGSVDYIGPGREYLIGFPDSLTDQTIVSELMPEAPHDLYNLWGRGALVYTVRTTSGELTVNTLEYGEQTLTQFARCIDDCRLEKPNINLSLYPNPTTDRLSISSTEKEINSVKIFDQLGRFLAEHHFTLTPPSTVNVSIGHLPAGIYNLVINTDVGSYYRRVVKR